MNFRDFMKSRPELLAAHPGALDLTETNLASALQFLRPEPTADELPVKAHRCHLAEYWLDAFGLPRDLKPQALVSEGVRQALGLLFGGFAADGLRALIPGDVYPVYLDLATKSDLSFTTYAAEHPITLDMLEGCDVLLVTNPAKPWGTWLTREAFEAIDDWLAADAARRVIVDCVYLWDDELPLELFRTNQAYLLHSLSKGWLRPLVMGVALVPPQDVERWTPVFRGLSLPQENLRLAQTLLTSHVDFPAAVPLVLWDAEARMRAALEKRGLGLAKTPSSPARYHFIVDKDWQSLLRDYGILGLPLETFGMAGDRRTVVTSLSFGAAA